MLELLNTLVQQAPNFIGLAIAVVILLRQNEKFIEALLERIELLEREVTDLKMLLGVIKRE